jgi:hypothetical protein
MEQQTFREFTPPVPRILPHELGIDDAVMFAAFEAPADDLASPRINFKELPAGSIQSILIFNIAIGQNLASNENMRIHPLC